MTDVLKQLPPFSWRRIRVPVTSRNVSFAHALADHPIVFRDGRLVQMTGRDNWRFRYGVPIREDIDVPQRYAHLFVQTLAKLVDAMRDRSPGELVDPIYGAFRCVPVSFADDTDVGKRDGTDLSLEFEHAPLPEETDVVRSNLDSIRGARKDAGSLDDAVKLVNWKQEKPPEPSTDPLSAIDGLGRQIEGIGAQVSAKLDDAAFRLEKLEATIDRLQHPELWPLRRSARRLRDSVHRLKAKVDDPGRIIRQTLQRTERTLSSVAQDAGMTIQDLLRLNPGLAGAPVVPAGTRVYFYERKAA